MTSRWVLGLVALILVSLHSQFLWRTATGEIAQVPATDFRRDLEGALAIERGEVPYQRLGEINPEQFAETSAADWWVAHSPAALAHARVLLAVVGYEGANTLMRVLSLFGGFGLAGALAYLLRDRKGLALTVGAAVLLSRPLGLDVRWGQALSLVGLGLLGVLLLVRSERVGWAKVLLGLLAAWKVWPIVFALFLPRRGSRLPDFVHVAAIATFINLAVLPYVGGASSLWSWVGVALPGNLARSLPESISVAGLIGMPPPAATLLFLFGLAVGLWVGSRLEVEWQPVTGALAYFVFAPLVWDFYWMLGFAAL
ncbi:MAG: glycosyltransferase 87 family protein, partial [Acidimicrobiia bacterium]